MLGGCSSPGKDHWFLQLKIIATNLYFQLDFLTSYFFLAS